MERTKIVPIIVDWIVGLFLLGVLLWVVIVPFLQD
jgi:hypothetical protein